MKYIQNIEDCKRIQEALYRNQWYADLAECEDIWNWVSAYVYDASWLDVPNDDQIYPDIMRWIKTTTHGAEWYKKQQ